ASRRTHAAVWRACRPPCAAPWRRENREFRPVASNSLYGRSCRVNKHGALVCAPITDLSSPRRPGPTVRTLSRRMSGSGLHRDDVLISKDEPPFPWGGFPTGVG